MPTKPNRLWLTALLIAWSVDFLFFRKTPGLSLFLWVLIVLAGVYILARIERVGVSRLSYILTALILILGMIPFFRREPFTVAISFILALVLLMVLAATFRNGNWLFYRVWDYVAAGFELVIATISRPFSLPRPRAAANGDPAQPAAGTSFWKGAAPVLRGLLIALPIVALLAALLSSADLIFAKRLQNLFSWFDLARLPEYIFRLFYILVLTYLFTGALAHALFPSKEVARSQDPNRPIIKPFLGWTEAGIVLACVNALFIFFVILQVQYLFGGEANITAAGFTYSEYARRGFSELVAVAVISLLLYLGLGEITRRDTLPHQRGFSLLSVLLVGLVLVILASAFQRLLLYETAYGFTRLRTYTFILIFWLALLLLATIVLELIRQRGKFGPALLIAAVGFGLTFGALNVDGWIARQNIQRAVANQQLDAVYLNILSSDAVPAIVKFYNQSSTPTKVRDSLGGQLACRQAMQATEPQAKWQSLSFSAISADQAMAQVKGKLTAYTVWEEDHIWHVRTNGEEHTCNSLTGPD